MQLTVKQARARVNVRPIARFDGMRSALKYAMGDVESFRQYRRQSARHPVGLDCCVSHFAYQRDLHVVVL